MAKVINFVSEVLDREFTYEIPFKVTCTVSGLVKTYTLESYINRVIDRFGGLEKVHAKYVCKDAKRLLKEGKTVEEVILLLNPPKTDIPVETPTPAVEEVTVPETVAEKMEEILQEVEEVISEQVEEVITKPLAKKDSSGKYRNSRGHVISADKLEFYQLQD